MSRSAREPSSSASGSSAGDRLANVVAAYTAWYDAIPGRAAGALFPALRAAVKVATGNDATTSNIIRFGRSRARLMRPPAWKAPQPDIEAELQSAVGLSEQQ